MTSGLTIVVMGVSGCGKSSVAQCLATRLGAHFKDADELHSVANVERMAAGQPLRDSDRLPWLAQVAEYAQAQTSDGRACVIACSALRLSYRQLINRAGRVLYVYLRGDAELILSRMREREGHFMPESLLQSQFVTLEVPDPQSEAVVSVSIDASLDDIVEFLVTEISHHPINASADSR